MGRKGGRVMSIAYVIEKHLFQSKGVPYARVLSFIRIVDCQGRHWR